MTFTASNGAVLRRQVAEFGAFNGLTVAKDS